MGFSSYGTLQSKWALVHTAHCNPNGSPNEWNPTQANGAIVNLMGLTAPSPPSQRKGTLHIWCHHGHNIGTSPSHMVQSLAPKKV
jgi:hypothetical protein